MYLVQEHQISCVCVCVCVCVCDYVCDYVCAYVYACVCVCYFSLLSRQLLAPLALV